MFFVTFSLMRFQESSLVMRMLVAVGTALAAIILWYILAFWEGSDWGWLKHLFDTKNRCAKEVDIDASPAGEAPSFKPNKQRWQWAERLGPNRRINPTKTVRRVLSAVCPSKSTWSWCRTHA